MSTLTSAHANASGQYWRGRCFATVKSGLVVAMYLLVEHAVDAQLIVPKEVSVGPSVQPVIALLLRSYQDTQFYLLPFSVMELGQWGRRRLERETQAGSVVSIDRDFAERLLTQKFYYSFDTSVSFTPTVPGQYRLIDCPNFALKGTLCGDLASTKEADFSGIVMSNRPIGWRTPIAAATPPGSEVLLRLTRDAALEALRRGRASADIGKYEKPQVKLALQFDLAKDRKAYWIHFLRLYPRQAAPPVESWEPPDFPTWSLEHFAIIEETLSGGYKVLWQAAYFNDNVISQHRMRILGLCDADEDGTAELVLLDTKHEFISYNMYTLTDGKLQKTACIAAAL